MTMESSKRNTSNCDPLSNAPDESIAECSAPDIETATKQRREHSPHRRHPSEQQRDEKNPSLYAYLLLCSAVIGLSSIGPLLGLQRGVGATMKILWRTMATTMVMFPAALYYVYREGFPNLSYVMWFRVFLTAAAQAGMNIYFVWALKYTSVGNAVILGNCQPLMILIGKILMGEPVSFMKGTGAIVAFSGALLYSKDSIDGSLDDGARQMLGNFYAVLSSGCGVAYLLFAKTVRSTMNLNVFMFFMMYLGSLQTLFLLVISGEPVAWSLDRHHGIWGWTLFQPDRLPLELVMVLVCNIVGTMGYVRSMQFFDTLVISTAALMEPVVAEFMAFSVGVAILPGWKGWLGNVLVATGTYTVVHPTPPPPPAPSRGKSFSRSPESLGP